MGASYSTVYEYFAKRWKFNYPGSREVFDDHWHPNGPSTFSRSYFLSDNVRRFNFYLILELIEQMNNKHKFWIDIGHRIPKTFIYTISLSRNSDLPTVEGVVDMVTAINEIKELSDRDAIERLRSKIRNSFPGRGPRVEQQIERIIDHLPEIEQYVTRCASDTKFSDLISDIKLSLEVSAIFSRSPNRNRSSTSDQRSVHNQKPVKSRFTVPEQTKQIDNSECVVCMTAPRETLIIRPCNHLPCCRACLVEYLKKNDLCPICRTNVEKVESIFI